MALLVMSGVLITGASLGTIAVLNLRQGRLIDDSIGAFAAAESGAEQSLYQLRRVGTSSVDLSANPSHGSSLVFSGPPLANGGSWNRSVWSNESTIYVSVPQDKDYELTLWNPDAPMSPAGIESLKFAWSDACGGTSALEVMAVDWDPVTAGAGPFSAEIAFHGSGPTLTFLHDPVAVIDNSFQAARAYRVRLRAKNCDIPSLNITAYSADNGLGLVVNLPSRVAVDSTGAFGTAKQAVEFRLPRLQPLTGAFDYAIFSQCSIVKGVTSPVCP
jgi:hypothetical protein